MLQEAELSAKLIQRTTSEAPQRLCTSSRPVARNIREVLSGRIGVCLAVRGRQRLPDIGKVLVFVKAAKANRLQTACNFSAPNSRSMSSCWIVRHALSLQLLPHSNHCGVQ